LSVRGGVNGCAATAKAARLSIGLPVEIEGKLPQRVRPSALPRSLVAQCCSIGRFVD